MNERFSLVGRARPLCFGFALVALGACQAVAGIKEHHYDETLGDGGPKTDGGGSPGNDAGASSSALCEDYCKAITEDTQLCRFEYAVYTDENACLSTCAKLAPGKPGDRKANTVECRKFFAGIVGERSDCPKAGPGGGGSAYCGDNCESYCSLMSQVCDKEYKAYGFSGVDECVTKCHGIRDLDVEPLMSRDSTLSLQASASGGGTVLDHDGDTVQCRLYHVTVASQSPESADAHCWHASLRPFPKDDMTPNPCSKRVDQTAPDCEDYCRIVEVACGGTPYAQYEDKAQCMAVCSELAQGAIKDPTGNTVSCRNYHAYNSVTDPMTHCGHAGPGGGDEHHCGTDCDSYCELLKDNCSAQFDQIGGTKTCVSTCNDWRPDNYAYSVDSSATAKSPLSCRILKLAQARALVVKASVAKTTADTAALCDAAIGKGGC